MENTWMLNLFTLSPISISQMKIIYLHAFTIKLAVPILSDSNRQLKLDNDISGCSKNEEKIAICFITIMRTTRSSHGCTICWSYSSTSESIWNYTKKSEYYVACDKPNNNDQTGFSARKLEIVAVLQPYENCIRLAHVFCFFDKRLEIIDELNRHNHCSMAVGNLRMN